MLSLNFSSIIPSLPKKQTMKKINFLVPALALVLFATPALANLQDKIETHQERAENREERRQEVKEKRQESRSERLEAHGTRLQTRFDAYYTRLNNIITKLESRITATTNKDTTAAKAKLQEAKDMLQQAKTLADSAVSQFKAIDPVDWEDQKDAAKAARDTAQKARLAFVDTIKLINDTVKLLKSAQPK
ncbi:hypothetical protein A2572_04870 [Candidatus Collierbacteria bacterium RIFOXYD1_FULL_40_9]|uniref:DUF5667 domain-containing protein n=1 Tax=Candidatus Collierbacteria bacterium RIFOXYD1_FULL_40_9 TaxID=1817731 RepID=A0A1F5FVG6_9BACT|nr:MAG: hypothetical protein A2572_04870 [Candidatus Collierbacteria bacterium RIFOXYD1_FULL_40_9]